jgi:hypothetical protein
MISKKEENYPSIITTKRFYEVSKILACGIYRLKEKETEKLAENQLDCAVNESVHNRDFNLKICAQQ